MLQRLLEEGWITVALALAMFVGLIFATSFGGLRRGLKVIAVGLLVPWSLWLVMVIGSAITEGVGSPSFAFVLGGGLGMVAIGGSAFWLMCAAPGLAFGLFGRWWLRWLAANPSNTPVDGQ